VIVRAIGDLLPSAVGVALSPVPIVAIVLMLGTPRARTTGTAFALGWIGGLSLAVVLVTLVSSGASSDDDPSTAVGWVKLILGGLCLASAIRTWKGRPGPGETAETPAWMAGLDAVAAGRAAILGAALAGVNPKNLALSVAAAASVGQAALSGAETAITLATFVILASASVAGPVVFFLLAPQRAAAPLNSLKDAMAAHNDVIMAVVLLVLGAKLAGDGLAIVGA